MSAANYACCGPAYDAQMDAEIAATAHALSSRPRPSMETFVCYDMHWHWREWVDRP